MNLEQQLQGSVRYGTQISAFCCQGRRLEQQDAYGISAADEEKGQLLLAADGMGGLSYGGEISRLLVDTMLERFESRPMENSSAAFLMEVLGDANASVNAFLKDRESGGSTLLAALIRGREMTWLSVGDSRIYLARGGGLIRLTREHNLSRKLHMLLLNGLMTPNDIEDSHQKRALTSYVGMGELAEVDMNLTPLTLLPGDTVLLLTDGVFGTLSEEEIAGALTEDVGTAGQRLAELVEQNQREVQDNYTGVLYRAEGDR